MDLLARIEQLELEAKSFGFNWETSEQVMQQIHSECVEIQEHLEANHKTPTSTLEEEIGDLLHATISLCVFCGFQSEKILQQALEKFAKRFNMVKQVAYQQGLTSLHELSFSSRMAIWDQAKILLEDNQPQKNLSTKSLSSFETNKEIPIVDPSIVIDERIEKSCFTLIDWPLSRVFLKNTTNYPWFILVPKRSDITELTQLCKADREQLIDEAHQLSTLMQTFFHPDKINLGALGNVVAQFHFHVVGRFKHDPLWPQGIWQTVNEDTPYQNPELLLTELKDYLQRIY